MTKDEALKMAIEALEQACGLTPRDAHFCKAIQACKEALEQPAEDCQYGKDVGMPEYSCIGKCQYAEYPAQDSEVQEPYKIQFPTMLRQMWSGGMVQDWIKELPKLYTHPAPLQNKSAESWQGNKEFVGLSDDEILILCAKMAAKLPNKEIDLIFARAIEQALKEKNNAV